MFFATHHSTPEPQILTVEAALAFHVFKHHNKFLLSDFRVKLYKCLFCDSQLAIKHARTKTQAIDNLLAPQVETGCSLLI